MIKENFNRDWLFSKESNPTNEKLVRLPHDAMIFEERSENNTTGSAGGYFPGGCYVYKKQFEVPFEAKMENWTLEFEGAYKDIFVFVNNQFAGTSHSGYLSFYVNISPYLKYGQKNQIEVKVKNDSIINSRWYTGSGLYRPVWLWKGGRIRIAHKGLRIHTPEVETAISQVNISIPIIFEGATTTKIQIHTVVRDRNTNVVVMENTPVTLFQGENPTITQRVYIKTPYLWSLETPNLYSCEILLEKDGEELDKVIETFGIRHIQMDPVNGIRINGKQILLRGACIHHDLGVIGAATFYDAEEYRIKICKEAGFNTVRIAHQPASKYMLEACDRLGMLVLEESFDVWNHGKNNHDYAENFYDLWERDVEAIVEKDFNHPSVFMYCIGNEIPELAEDDGIRYSRMISDKFHVLDTTRPVTNAINGQVAIGSNALMLLLEMGILSPEQIEAVTGNANAGHDEVAGAVLQALATGNINDVMTALIGNLGKVIEHPCVDEKLEEAMSHLDICGYNYMMRRYKMDMEKHPNRVIYGSETNPPEIDKLWSYSKDYKACIGDFTWTGWDYIGEAGVGITRYDGKKEFTAAYPAYLAYCGDMDITGYRRPASYFREIVFGLRENPYISVQDPCHFHEPATTTPWSVPETIESWTWPGYEGMPIRVSVFAKGDEVSLLCNGREIGRAPAGEKNRFQTQFEIDYEPGELTVVSFTKGKEDGRFTLVTAKESVQLQTTLSKKHLCSDEDDLCYLTIELVDQDGVFHRDFERKISVETEGGIQIQGFGNADPFSRENFYGKEHLTFRGRALVVLRGMEKGIAKIKVSCEGSESVIHEIEIV